MDHTQLSQDIQKIINEHAEFQQKILRLEEENNQLKKENELHTTQQFQQTFRQLQQNNHSLQEENNQLSQGFDYWEIKCHGLQKGIQSFVEKNYSGGAKADREDYTQMVSYKDIYELAQLIKK